MREFKPSPSILFGFAGIIVLAFAFFYNYTCGLRNLYRADSSVFFDAGYRILHGELPFRDFYAPIVSYLFWLQALFFKIFHVSYASFVSLASVMNAAAAGLVILITMRIYPNRWIALVSGLMTAIWFAPMQKGIPWYSSGAFFLIFVVLWLLLRKPQSLFVTCMSGLLISLSFFTKQPTGAGAGLLIGLYLLQIGSVKRAFFLAGSFTVSFTAILILFTGWGGWDIVWRYLFFLPMTSSPTQDLLSIPFLSLCLATVLFVLFTFKHQEWFLAILTALFFTLCIITEINPHQHQRHIGSLFIFIPLFFLFIIRERNDRALLMAMVLMQYVSERFSQGSVFSHWPYIGIIFGMTWKALREHVTTEKNPTSRFLFPGLDLNKVNLLMCGIGAFVIYMGVRTSLLKQISGPWGWIPFFWPVVSLVGIIGTLLFARQAFRRHLWQPVALAVLFSVMALYGFSLSVKSFKTVFFNEKKPWLDPRNQLVAVDIEGFEGAYFSNNDIKMLKPVVAYLKNLPPDQKPFVVLPHFTLIHAILHEPYPHPFLFFARGLTHRPEDPNQEHLCQALRSHGVRTIAMAEGKGSQETVEDFPCLIDWMNKEFVLRKKIEEFNFYQLKDPN